LHSILLLFTLIDLLYTHITPFYTICYVRMGQPIIHIGSTRSYINNRLGRSMTSQIDPETVEGNSKTRSGPTHSHLELPVRERDRTHRPGERRARRCWSKHAGRGRARTWTSTCVLPYWEVHCGWVMVLFGYVSD